MVEQARSAETSEKPKSEFIAKLEARWQKGNFVCVGLDSDYSQISEEIKSLYVESDLPKRMIASFNREIIDATADLVCAYKPNIAFYEAYGHHGIEALIQTMIYLKMAYPEIPVILDAKRADIGNTNLGYVKMAFDELGADAITVHPYLGKEALQPFLDRKDKGIFVLVRTSNPGADEFQDLPIHTINLTQDEINYFYDINHLARASVPLHEVVAYRVSKNWNENGNVGVVAGATFPKELLTIRSIIGDMPMLIPGVGTQGGEVSSTVNNAKDSRRMGMIINASRSIIFASKGEDFAEAARNETVKLTEEINKYRVTI